MQSHGTEHAPMRRDEVLVWLNDRVDQSVHVWVELEHDGYGAIVLEAEGRLRHWRESDADAEVWANRPRPDVIGRYGVGEARVDLTDLDHCDARARDDLRGVEISLSANVTLRIVGQRTGVALDVAGQGDA
jgi:hypothetical protein